jgi:D-amino-acid oxidase
MYVQIATCSAVCWTETAFGPDGSTTRCAPLIVNCAGLGAKTLFSDAELTPVKGQLTLLLPQADVNYAYLKGSPTGLLYMFPRSDAIILGGSQQAGVWTTDPDETLAEEILAGHAAISAGMR